MTDQTDVFVSYDSRDRHIVFELVRQLEDLGLDVWFDVDNMGAGLSLPREIGAALEATKCVIVAIGSTSLDGWNRLEVDAAIDLAASSDLSIIPVLLPGARGHGELPIFLQHRAAIDLRDGVRQEPLAGLGEGLSSTPTARLKTSPIVQPEDMSVAELLASARSRVIISAQSFDRFVRSQEVRDSLAGLPRHTASLSVIMLNPAAAPTQTQAAFYDLESPDFELSQHHDAALEFFKSLRDVVGRDSTFSLEVVLTNYLPRYRAVVVDDDVYIYFYMYGSAVRDLPDLVLRHGMCDQAEEVLRQRFVHSIVDQLNAPETIEFVRLGQVFSYATSSHIAGWPTWSKQERYNQRITHHFYNAHAKRFHERFGDELEKEVAQHLDRTFGRTLVLGCGSGKEVRHVKRNRPGDVVLGLDSSPLAISIARAESPAMADCFFLGDFYDLDRICATVEQFNAPFDSIVANAAFVHLWNRDDMRPLLNSIARQLNTSGVLLLRSLYKENSDGQPIDCDYHESRERWFDPRWFVYYSRAELSDLCDEAGLRCLNAPTEHIAKDLGFSSVVESILKRGFTHRQFENVFWPIVVAEKDR